MGTDIVLFDARGAIRLVANLSPETLELYESLYLGRMLVSIVADMVTDYVLGDAITPRPANPATLVGTTLSSLPAPCTITINGTEYACDDNFAELAFTHPGSYKIQVAAWPYLDADFEVAV